MNLGKISVRYAKAFFLVAREQKQLSPVAGDMNLLLKISREIPAFRSFQSSPVFTISRRKKIIHKFFGEQLQTLTLSFLDLVIENNRLEFIEGIARYFLDLYKKEKGITSVTLTTAQPVVDDIREKLVAFIKAKTTSQIKLEENIDPALVGGFILKVEDEQIDASISTQLQTIKKELTR